MNYTDKDFVDSVIRIAEAAGEEILKFYKSDEENLETKSKVDSMGMESPVTAADLAANDVIETGLNIITPEIPVVSEEKAEEDNQAAAKEDMYWLVDPLDGTKSFIKQDGQFTVNIALVKDNSPVFGVVYIPAEGSSFFNVGDKAFKRVDGNEEEIRATENEEVAIAVASKNHLDENTAKFLEQFGDIEVIQAGSSLKICRVAEGKADVYPRLMPTTMEWDTAAADAVLRAAGGKMTSINGENMIYSKLPELRNTGFVASGANTIFSLDQLV